MKHRTFWIFFLLALFATADTEIFAQAQAVKLHYSGKGGYSLVERTNLRRYVNGKYVGLTSREVRSFVSPSEPPLMRFKAKGSVYENDQWYDGSFYVMEETLRNSQAAGAGIHEAVQSVFHISKNGQLTMYKDNGYPSFRSFPAYTADKVNVGESWKAVAERSVDPLNKGIFTKIPMQVLYTFSGAETYKGQAVYRIKAIWQTYYDAQNRDFGGDSSLQKARGGHKADIIVLQETGEPILTIDNVDETFFWIDGTQVNFKGTITLFTEFPPAFDSQRIMAALNRVATVKGGKTGQTAGKVGSGKKTGADAVKTEKFVPDEIFDNFDKNKTVAKNTKNTVSSGKTVLEKVDDVLPKNNIVAEEVSAGIRLSIRDIKFAPDSAQILSGESERLDEIAEVLKMAPNAQLLVEGHTASVGKPAGEQKLSEQRAHKIAEELKARGVKAGAFICRGFGGTKPVASNETNEGRAQNRRVEITILK